MLSRRCEKLVAEVMESSGTQKKGNVRRWKPLQGNGCLYDSDLWSAVTSCVL
jgi:hypothetical protein